MSRRRAGVRMARLGVVLAASASLGCPRRAHEGPARRAPEAAPEAVPEARADAAVATGTPVQLGEVGRATLQVTVEAPGRTDALRQLKVRAPFGGLLETLKVQDGDRVRPGQLIGTVVSTNSRAALLGAQEMLRTARTPAERRDARRAIQLARRSQVTAPLRAPEGGVVLRHGATQGSLVTPQEEIVRVAALGSFVFVAQVQQADLPRVHPGERAEVRLPATPRPVPGRVHGILPAASGQGLTVPVRIDLSAAGRADREKAKGGRFPLAVNLFGTARIVVGEHPDATVVPSAAVLQNDVTSVSRVALVGAGGRARWVTVRPGLVERGLTEILAPPLAEGQEVIVSGQVGLPEGAPVQVAAADGGVGAADGAAGPTDGAAGPADGGAGPTDGGLGAAHPSGPDPPGERFPGVYP